MTWLTVGFFVTALLYASVGFGGGSTYSALLALAKTDFRLIPVIGPICNIIVTTGGAIRFHRAGLVPWRRMAPLVLISAPMALLGGRTPIKEPLFLGLLAAGLIVAGLTLLLQRPIIGAEDARPRSRSFQLIDLGVSALIGFLSGLVGLGGGIFLAPYLHFTRWAGAKRIAATASAYILINSIATLTGQLLKLKASGNVPDISGYWPLVIAVLIGGQIGSIAGIKMLTPIMVRRATAILILYVAGNLIWKLASA
jgi:uncharacterized protein